MISIQSFGSSSKGNCYRIKTSTNGDELLLDAGLSFKEIQRYCRFNFLHLCGTLLTHQHGDHSKAVNDLLKLGHRVYMLKDTADALYVTGHHKVINITPKVQFTIGNFSILPFELEHDVPNFGFLILTESKNYSTSQIPITAGIRLRMLITLWLNVTILMKF